MGVGAGVGAGVDEVSCSDTGALQDAGVVEIVVMEAADGMHEVST